MPGQSTSWDASPSAQERRFTGLCAGSAFAIALLAEAGWLFHARFLAGQWGGYIPMPPSAALALLLLSSGVFSHEHWSAHRLSRRLVLVLAGLPALLGLLILAHFFTGLNFGVEWVLSRTNEAVGRIPVGRMSPLGVGMLLLESGALILLLHATRWRFAASGAALSALLATAGSLVFLVGYAYGAPLLYGGATIPVPLPSALAFVLLGAGEISLALRGVPAVRAWIGGSTRGMLVRAFLPAMLFFILIEDWVQFRTEASLNPALLHSLTALVCGVLIVLVSFLAARRAGDAIDRAGETLRASEERFRRMFQHSATSMALVSPDFCFLQVNDAFCKMLGYSESELVGKTFQDVTLPEDRPVGAKLTDQVLSGQTEMFHLEKRYLRQDGTVVWGLVSSTLIRDTQNKPLHFITQIQDITEGKQAEQALRESEQRHRTILQTAMDGFWVTDMQGRLLEVNEAYCRMSGYSAGQLLAMHIPDLSANETAGETAAHIQKFKARGEDRFESRHRHKDGSVFDVEVSVQYRPTDGGRLVVFLRDVTQRKQAEEALRARETQLSLIYDNVNDVVFVVGVEPNDRFRFTSVNRRFAQLTGLQKDQVVGKLVQEVIPKSAQALIFEKYKQAIRDRQPVHWEEVSVYPAGRKLGEVTVAPLFDAAGNCTQLIGTVHDITERKQADEERGFLQAQLAQTQKMESVGRLAGGVAHDFNNLLTVINGYAAFLSKRLAAQDPLRAYALEIAKAGEHAASLTSQLLAFGRKQITRPRVIDLNGVVTDAEGMLRRLLREDIELVTRLTPHLGLVMADPDQIHRVIMNLVVNAGDAMPNAGKLEIATTDVEVDEAAAATHPGATRGRYAQLTVTDTGTGMTEEVRRNIFEPFFTTKAQGQGTGLGLSMVHGIVKQSGGFIEVDSEPGRGTTFRIYLPRVGDAPAESGKPAAVPAMRGNKTVLVVEDQSDVRAYVASALADYGYHVIQAEGAGEALLRCEQEGERIDLVLTDVVMPNISGRELAERLEKLQPGMKVLFMSGYTADIIARHGIPEQGVVLIEKPFLPDQLAIKVQEVLGEARADRATVLVAEDSAPVRKILSEILREAGCTVVEACDGVEALEKLREGHVQLALIDANMPRLGGPDAAREMRKQCPEVKIVLMSAAFEGIAALEPAALDVDGLLPKPMEPKVLLAMVRRLLALRRRS